VAINNYYSFKYLKFNYIKSYKWWFFLICLVFPILLALSLLILHIVKGDVIGDVELWCWLLSKYSAERLIYFYGWLFLCFIICTTCYIRTICITKLDDVTKIIMINFTLYMSTFFIAWTAACINRIFEWTNPDVTNSKMTLFQAFFEPLQGFLLAITYGCCTRRKALGYKQIQ